MNIDKTKPAYLMLFLGGVSLLTRLLLLGSKSLWIDECLAWGAVRMGWMDMFSSVASGTPHPPVAFLLMKFSTLIAGDGEFGLRFVIALVVASAVVPVFRLASRRTTVTGGFWAAMVWALCPFAVSLGQEAWVYGINAAISLWFADTADLAWRGSGKAFAGAIVIGVTGLLTQHIFVITVAAGCVLYFTITPAERIPFKRFLVVPVVLALFYTPVFLFFSEQFKARSARMAGAGFESGFGRLLSLGSVSQMLRFWAGGLLPELGHGIPGGRLMLAFVGVNAVVFLSLVVWPFFTRMLKPQERKYLWIAMLLPLGLYITDDPTVRQLSCFWIPLTITSAAVFARYRFLGCIISALCLLALVPYYRINEFPYHRSNWRDAVASVESRSEPGDIVVVFGGKSTSLAWEYYSETEMECLTPAGNNPFAGERDRHWIDPVFLLDSLQNEGGHKDVWIILDVWGIRSIESIKGEYSVYDLVNSGINMEVALLKSIPEQ